MLCIFESTNNRVTPFVVELRYAECTSRSSCGLPVGGDLTAELLRLRAVHAVPKLSVKAKRSRKRRKTLSIELHPHFGDKLLGIRVQLFFVVVKGLIQTL